MTHTASESTPLVADHGSAVHHHYHQHDHQHQHQHHHNNDHDRNHHHHHHEHQQPFPPDHFANGTIPIYNSFPPNRPLVANNHHKPCSCTHCKNRSPTPDPFLAILVLIAMGFFIFVGFNILSSRTSYLNLFPAQPVDPRLTHLPPPSFDTSNNPIKHADSLSHEIPQPSRRQIIRETYKSISGHFDLYDLLDLSTSTGTIDITITPHPGTVPAVLSLQTKTGSITVRLANSFLTTTMHPETVTRPFETDIQSSTGTITVTYLLGNGGTTTITSSTGTQNLDFLTVGVGPHDPVTQLRTSAITGAQAISVRSLSPFDAGSMVHVAAEHTSRATGSVDVWYGETWQGRVEVRAVTKGVGTVDVDGSGVVIDRWEDGYVLAHRGEVGDRGVGVRVVGHGTGDLRFGC